MVTQQSTSYWKIIYIFCLDCQELYLFAISHHIIEWEHIFLTTICCIVFKFHFNEWFYCNKSKILIFITAKSINWKKKKLNRYYIKSIQLDDSILIRINCIQLNSSWNLVTLNHFPCVRFLLNIQTYKTNWNRFFFYHVLVPSSDSYQIMKWGRN